MQEQQEHFQVYTTRGETYSLEVATGQRQRLARSMTPAEQLEPLVLLPQVDLPAFFLERHRLDKDDPGLLSKLLDPATLAPRAQFEGQVRLVELCRSVGEGRGLVATALVLAAGERGE